MAGEQYELIPGPDARSIRIIFRGFWDEGVLNGYREALRKREAEAGGVSLIARALIDLRECSIQSQAVMDGFAEIIETYSSQMEQYGVCLPKSALLGIQMKRLMAGTPAIFFEDEKEALKWLEAQS